MKKVSQIILSLLLLLCLLPVFGEAPLKRGASKKSASATTATTSVLPTTTTSTTTVPSTTTVNPTTTTTTILTGKNAPVNYKDRHLAEQMEKFQKDPSDENRANLIKFVQTMKPAPALPEEARKNFIKGGVFLKEASDNAGVALAVEAYQNALVIAPWWGAAYYNLAVARQLAGQYDEAAGSLNFYLLTNPGAKEAEKVQEKLYELEAKKELAQKQKAEADSRDSAQQQAAESSRAAQQAAQQKNSFAGKWKVTYSEANGQSRDLYVGNQVEISDNGGYYTVDGPDLFLQSARYSLSGRTLSGNYSPEGDELVEIFSSTPAEVARQAQGRVVYQCVLNLAGDGKTIYAQHDNWCINYTRNQSFWGTGYQFSNAQRYPAWFKFTLQRLE